MPYLSYADPAYDPESKEIDYHFLMKKILDTIQMMFTPNHIMTFLQCAESHIMTLTGEQI